MAKPVIWITRTLSGATLERARRDYEVIWDAADKPGSAEDIIGMSTQVDGIIPCHSEHFTADVVAQLDPRLKIVANHSVGVDHCDLPALKSKGITVTNTPGVLSDATAELAMMLMLGAARHVVTGDRIVRSGEWDSWSPAFLVGKQVTGARLGIIGMGGVGRALARKARGFDMEIHYHNRHQLSFEDEAGGLSRETRRSSGKIRLSVPALPCHARDDRPDKQRPPCPPAQGQRDSEHRAWQSDRRVGIAGGNRNSAYWRRRS